MSRILVFAAGALFGATCAFYFLVVNRPEPATAQVSACPTQPAALAPLQSCVTLPWVAVAPPVPAESAPLAEAASIAITAEPTVGASQASAMHASVPWPQAGSLLIPVAGVEASQLSDTFSDSRGGARAHDAIDIMAPRGTAVAAVDDGRLVKLFNSVPGGLTVYQFDTGERFAYYYAHLDSYAPGIVEGKLLKRGELIGHVGYSGNASPAAPHLHFAIFVLGPEKRWWEGTAINPYPFLDRP
jgi:murein DD-endopeptidase MepM/ murein hydrolase activator NlpD